MLVSIREAISQGVERLRQPQWSNPFDHIKIDILGETKYGPWVHLWCPLNLKINGQDPMDILIMQFDIDEKAWEVYTGPIGDSEEYKSERSKYDDIQL